ncbi:MAG: 50S ribosomal protein L25 [Gemmataceae bacterium]|nr:50S ribosomal protein L25 [Gemmataceae bacterium]MDW8242537.1 50S ribosomal protein L25 [Thermogemmata sp.]
MQTIATLKATPRPVRGTRAARKLRQQGLVPAIIYGHNQPNQAVAISRHDIDHIVRVQHSRMITLDLDGQQETVLIREVQWDVFGREIIHVDFQRKSAEEKVRVVVPIELRNSPKQAGGAVLDQPLHTVHVECPLGVIPEAIRVDITNLSVGHPIQVKDLPVPTGVRILEPPEAVVVQLKVPGAAAEAAAAPPGETPTAPEVIKKERKTEETEGDK